VSTHWSGLQNTYLLTTNKKSKDLTGEKWSKAICTIVTTSWLELWDQRNNDRHGVDSSTKSIALREQAIRELEALYTYQDTVLQKHRNLCTKSIAFHLKGNTNYIRQWINTYQSVITKSAKDTKQKSIINVRMLTSYFKHCRT
jgi:hypothetical protein